MVNSEQILKEALFQSMKKNGDLTKADLTACTTQAQVDGVFKAAWLAIVAAAQ
jgi:hypothetical protein